MNLFKNIRLEIDMLEEITIYFMAVFITFYLQLNIFVSFAKYKIIVWNKKNIFPFFSFAIKVLQVKKDLL